MDTALPVLCVCDGDLVKDNAKYKYTGGTTKTFFLPRSSSFDQLIDLIYRFMNIKKDEYDISIKVVYPSTVPCPPVEILDDGDVALFIAHSIRNVNNSNIPLLVRRVQKCPISHHIFQTTLKRKVPEICSERSKVCRKKSKIPPVVNTEDSLSRRDSSYLPTIDIGGSIENVSSVQCTQNDESHGKKILDNTFVDDIRFSNDDVYCGISDVKFAIDLNSYPTPHSEAEVGLLADPLLHQMADLNTEPTYSGDGCTALNALLFGTPKKNIYPKTVESDPNDSPNQSLNNSLISSSTIFRSSPQSPKNDMVKDYPQSLENDLVKEEILENRSWIVKAHNKEHLSCFEDIYINSGFQEKIKFNDDFRNLEIHQMFKDKISMIFLLNKYVMEANIKYMVIKSSKTRYTIKCKREGCPWRLHASKLNGTEVFQIKTLAPVHNCSLPQRGVDHQQATSRLISEFVKDRLEAHVLYTPKAIICDVQKKFGVKISYRKAWKAREIAINEVRGSYEDSYALLPMYCDQLMKTNSGTIAKIQREGGRFLRLFLALGQCIRVYRRGLLRPVIAVDGSHLKGKYKGTLFLATILDGDNHIFPIALGVGESENNNSWNWFLTQLRDALCMTEQMMINLVIISDRHMGLLSQVPVVFPHAYHGYCAFHISQNMFSKFKQPRLYSYFYNAAKATRPTKFYSLMETIKKVNKEAYEWLNNIDKERWTTAFFPRRRYNIITTNSSESYNSVLKEIREYPITMIIEEFRLKLQGMWFKRRNVATALTTILTTWAEKELASDMSHARDTSCDPINIDEYFVRSLHHHDHVVLSKGMCTCRKFDVMGMPCIHALAELAIYKTYPYKYCAHFYSADNYRSTYEESIYPVGDKSQWEVPELQNSEKLLPPMMKTPAGRPKKKRILSQGEERRTVKCGRCKRTGHNRKSCKFPIPQGD